MLPPHHHRTPVQSAIIHTPPTKLTINLAPPVYVSHFQGPSGAAPTALVKGEPLSYTSLKKEVIEASAGLERTLKGSYLKQNKEKDATEF